MSSKLDPMLGRFNEIIALQGDENLHTVDHSIIMIGRTYLNPYRLVRNWTGNSAARKQTSWMLFPFIVR
jgi:hypothetical protein